MPRFNVVTEVDILAFRVTDIEQLVTNLEAMLEQLRPEAMEAVRKAKAAKEASDDA